MKDAQCAIALGSNLGDSLNILETAIEKLSQTSGVTLNTYSRWYRTLPIGPPQPDYFNGCALLTVQLTPQELLIILLEIEQQFGRVRGKRWGPRILDLDILLYDNLVLDTPDLKIPHPHMKERAFVLFPLAEIAPNWIEPISQKNILQLLQNVDCSGIMNN